MTAGALTARPLKSLAIRVSDHATTRVKEISGPAYGKISRCLVWMSLQFFSSIA